MDENRLEEKKMLFDAVLTEYKEMKAESIHKLQVQITIISIYVTVFGVLLSLGLEDITRQPQDKKAYAVLSSPNFFSLIVPAVAICIAVIWLDQVYRQIKIAVYIAYLEKKINMILGVPNNIYSSAMFWEQWLRNNKSDRGKFNASQTFYYICLGIFLASPIVSFVFGWYLVDWNIKPICLSACIFAAGYAAFLCFTFMYVRRILAFNKLTLSQE